MKTPLDLPLKTPEDSPITAAQWCALMAQKEGQLNQVIEQQAESIRQRDNLIQLLEEQLRLARIQRFAAKSEKLAHQIDLFDEAELEAALDELTDETDTKGESKKPKPKKRQRGFSDKLARVRIELTLSEDEKAGAQRTFFTKVKEELEFIPATMQVLEYWQEKAVFAPVNAAGDCLITATETLIAAQRPIHPLGKAIISGQCTLDKWARASSLERRIEYDMYCFFVLSISGPMENGLT